MEIKAVYVERMIERLLKRLGEINYEGDNVCGGNPEFPEEIGTHS